MILDIKDIKVHISATEQLSWWQRQVCKCFKITPLLKSSYVICIQENCITGLVPNMLVTAVDGNTYLALTGNKLITTQMLASPPVIGNELKIIGSVFSEGNQSPKQGNGEVTRK